MSKLFILYKNIIINKFLNKFKYSSLMQVPKLIKIVINVGLNYKYLDKKYFNIVLDNLKLISCQKGIITKSKKSISNFKIRCGFPIGCKVTLRKHNMWNFLDRLIFIVIPRIRDFRGFSKKSIDKNGNLNIGIKEHIIFPEIIYDNIKYIHGMNISIVLNNCLFEESFYLFKNFLFPFRK